MGQSLTRSLQLPDATATEALARQLVKALPRACAGLVILLEGELGAGKSTLARAMLHAMGHRGAVPSPTYTLVEPYAIGDKIVYHIDLYRISSIDELEFLGWSELDDGLRLIEWPERIPGLEDQSDLRVALGYADPGRSCRLVALSDQGERILSGMNLK